MPTKRGYITPQKYTELTNRSISDLVEWERQANIAESFIDRVCGAYPSFHYPQTITITSATSNTLVSPELDMDKDNYYNNLQLDITSTGYSGFITGYSANTTTVTVSGSFSTPPDSTSVVVITPRATFPRIYDFDADGSPIIPEAVIEATAYAISYALITDETNGFNSSIFSYAQNIDSETIGNYSVSYSSLEDNSAIKQIGNRAYFVLQSAGLINRIASII